MIFSARFFDANVFKYFKVSKVFRKISYLILKQTGQSKRKCSSVFSAIISRPWHIGELIMPILYRWPSKVQLFWVALSHISESKDLLKWKNYQIIWVSWFVNVLEQSVIVCIKPPLFSLLSTLEKISGPIKPTSDSI